MPAPTRFNLGLNGFMASTYTPRLRSTCPPATRISSIRGVRSSARSLHTSSVLARPRKGAEDRDSLEPRSTEYSQAGDDVAAETEKTAFDPKQTSPEEQTGSAEQESGQNTNPLDVSPGNKKVSKQRDPQEGGAEASKGESEGVQSGRQRTSGGGSAPKAGGKSSG